MGNYYLIWVACNSSGSYRLFKQKPVRDTTTGVWNGDYDAKGQVAVAHLESLGIALPTISWESEPVQIKISVLWEGVEK